MTWSDGAGLVSAVAAFVAAVFSIAGWTTSRRSDKRSEALLLAEMTHEFYIEALTYASKAYFALLVQARGGPDEGFEVIRSLYERLHRMYALGAPRVVDDYGDFVEAAVTLSRVRVSSDGEAMVDKASSEVLEKLFYLTSGIRLALGVEEAIDKQSDLKLVSKGVYEQSKNLLDVKDDP